MSKEFPITSWHHLEFALMNFHLLILIPLLHWFEHRWSTACWRIPWEDQGRRVCSCFTLAAYKYQGASPLGTVFSVLGDNSDSWGRAGKAFGILIFFCIGSNPFSRSDNAKPPEMGFRPGPKNVNYPVQKHMFSEIWGLNYVRNISL